VHACLSAHCGCPPAVATRYCAACKAASEGPAPYHAGKPKPCAHWCTGNGLYLCPLQRWAPSYHHTVSAALPRPTVGAQQARQPVPCFSGDNRLHGPVTVSLHLITVPRSSFASQANLRFCAVLRRAASPHPMFLSCTASPHRPASPHLRTSTYYCKPLHEPHVGHFCQVPARLECAHACGTQRVAPAVAVTGTLRVMHSKLTLHRRLHRTGSSGGFQDSWKQRLLGQTDVPGSQHSSWRISPAAQQG